jgi:hypothetical protein
MDAKPDAPIGSGNEDLLGRLPFVAEIVDIAITTPKAWAPRIGIYGSWGAGKTSVLNLVEERLVAEHHIVARFNPWGFDDPDEMFGALADSVLDAIAAQGGEIKKVARRGEKASKVVEKAAKKVGEASKHGSELGVPGAKLATGVISTAGYVSGVLRRIFEKKKINELVEELQGLPPHTRCIVLADDIDRAQPGLLPPLLFALHEVLAAIPIAFIIALDPNVVGAALKAHHPGFGDGLSFLEKMIQFPRWLPDVTEEDLWRLATRDAQQYLPVMDRDALRQEFERFPRNPRELRTLLRGMWGLNAQAKRYREDEINWNLVLRLAVLRRKHRQALDVVLEDEELLTRMIGARLARQIRPHGSAIDTGVEDALRARALDPACAPELLEALGDSNLRWDGAIIIRHAHLLQRPPALTRREFDHIVDALPKNRDTRQREQDVQEALASHAKKLRRTLEAVLGEARLHALLAHNERMEQSADETLEEQTISQANAARELVAIVGAIVGSESGRNINADEFREILFGFSRWAHFTTLEAYRSLHGDEHALLRQLCQNATDPGSLLEVLSPWERQADRQEEAARVRRDLEAVLELRVEPTLDRIFERAGGINAMLREHRSSERWCLLKKATWTPARVARVASLQSEAAAENCLDMIRLLSNSEQSARPNRYGIIDAELDAMASDPAITDALWAVVSRRPVNLRLFSAVQRARAELERRRGTPLTEPPWFARLQQSQAQAALQPESDVDLEPAIPGG